MGSDWVVDSVLESGYQPGVPHQQFVAILLVWLPAFGLSLATNFRADTYVFLESLSPRPLPFFWKDFWKFLRNFHIFALHSDTHIT